MNNDEMITVLIKTIDNSSYNVNIQDTTTVSSLKTIIREHTSVQEDRQRLIYRGRVLLDNSTIQEYHIENGHTIHMVARPENYQELQQAAQANSISEETQAAAAARGVVASLLSSLPILTDARGNAANNANNIASDTNMEHIRQSLLTMHTLISIVDPPVPELVPIDDFPVQDNANTTLNTHEKGNEDTDISHDRGTTSTINNGTLSSSSLRGRQGGEGEYHYIKPIQFYIGQWVDVKDTVAQWLEATVMDINHNDKKVFIHYNGWPERWDEWIIWDSPRICPFRSRTSHTAIAASPTTHLNHFSPQPNIAIVHAPITGVNDIRLLLPEIASMFRRILPFVEDAASLAEESLQSKPPSSTQDPLLRTMNPRSNVSSSIPYRRASAATRVVSSINSSGISSIIPPNSLHPLLATTAANSTVIQPIAGITPRIAPGMPWEYVSHPNQPPPHHNRNTSIYNMQIDNEFIVEKRLIIDNTRSDYVDETFNYFSLESDLNERNRRQRLCTRSVDDITVRSSASANDDSMINYKDNIQSNGSNIHLNKNKNNKIDINNIASSYIEENISNSYSTRKRPAESNMQPQAWINSNSSNQSSSNYISNNRNNINTDECITQDYREKRLRILAQDLCPLLDRFGRMLSDVAPHLWNLSEPPHTDTSTTTNAINSTTNTATTDAVLRENEVSNISNNDSSAVNRGVDHIDSINSSNSNSAGSNRGDVEATIPVVTDSQFSLEASLLSLLRERPPSPPHDRIARAPIALNSRIGMGILPSSIGGGGGAGGGVTARGSTSVAVAGNNALLQSLLGDVAAGMGGSATTAMTNGTHISSGNSGGATVLRSTGTHAPTMVSRNGRQVDIHIAILAPASARMGSNNALTTTAAASTTAASASSNHINQRVASLSSSLQAQAENLATRTRQLSERTQQMTGYSAAINDVLRSLREQTNQTNTSNTTTTIDPSMNVVIADSSNNSLLENIESNKNIDSNYDSNNDDDDADEGNNDENDEHLLDDLIPSLSFTHDSSNNLESHHHNNEITNTHNILPINNISSESRPKHIDIAIMNEDEIMNATINTSNNQQQYNHQYSESHLTTPRESISTTTTVAPIVLSSIATTTEEPSVLPATSIEHVLIPIAIEDDPINSSSSPSAPVSNTVYDRLRRYRNV